MRTLCHAPAPQATLTCWPPSEATLAPSRRYAPCPHATMYSHRVRGPEGGRLGTRRGCGYPGRRGLSSWGRLWLHGPPLQQCCPARLQPSAHSAAWHARPTPRRRPRRCAHGVGCARAFPCRRHHWGAFPLPRGHHPGAGAECRMARLCCRCSSSRFCKGSAQLECSTCRWTSGTFLY